MSLLIVHCGSAEGLATKEPHACFRTERRRIRNVEGPEIARDRGEARARMRDEDLPKYAGHGVRLDSRAGFLRTMGRCCRRRWCE